MKLFKVQDPCQDFRFRLKRRAGDPRGVLLLSCGGLGDTALFSIVLPRLLALAGEGEAVTILLQKGSEKVAFLFPPQVEVETVDFGRLRKDLSYRRQIRERLFNANFRLIVHTDFLRHPHLDEALVGACRAPEAWAMEPRSWPKYDAELAANRALYTRLFDSGDPSLNKVLRWHGFADWLTETPVPVPQILIPEDRLPPPSEEPAPLVLIQPFSAVKKKQSPVSLYRRIIRELPDSYRVAITGAPSDLERNPQYRELLDLPGVEFDGSTFRDLLPRFRSARLVVSVDTASMHLAVMSGAPTLCLASAAYVGDIVPYEDSLSPANVRFLHRSMPCEGCFGNCTLPAENDMYPCVAALDPDEVVATAVEMLAGK